MATKPTPGASDGTYGTELNAFLDVSLADDGKILDGAAQSTSAAPTADAELANKLYVDNGGERDVNGSPVVVFTKYFTGTLDADDNTNVAHGVSSALAKILFVGVAIEKQSVGTVFGVKSYGDGIVITADNYKVTYSATNIVISDVGANYQSGDYRIKVEFIL